MPTSETQAQLGDQLSVNRPDEEPNSSKRRNTFTFIIHATKVSFFEHPQPFGSVS